MNGSLIKMTVLNDAKIKDLLSQEKLGIIPAPSDIQIQPASVDLRLDEVYLKFNKNSVKYIDTKREQNYTHQSIFTEEYPLILHPHDFILAQTYEFIRIPDNLLARVEGRSSVGRLGVTVHITAGFIDPGFEGNITLEIANLGTLPVALYPYQRICQIVFEELNDKAERPYGADGRNKYWGQNMPTASRIDKDRK